MRQTKHSSVATVLATLALAVALMGTGFAFGKNAPRQGASVNTTAAVTWHKLTLLHGWSYGDYDSYRPAWTKSNGVVYLRGSLAGGLTFSPNTAFRLPLAARPGKTLWLTTYANNGAPGAMYIDPDGRAYVFDDGGGSTAQTFTSLDGISFRVP